MIWEWYGQKIDAQPSSRLLHLSRVKLWFSNGTMMQWKLVVDCCSFCSLYCHTNLDHASPIHLVIRPSSYPTPFIVCFECFIRKIISKTIIAWIINILDLHQAYIVCGTAIIHHIQLADLYIPAYLFQSLRIHTVPTMHITYSNAIIQHVVTKLLLLLVPWKCVWLDIVCW